VIVLIAGNCYLLRCSAAGDSSLADD
jgi:hypothetical protein